MSPTTIGIIGITIMILVFFSRMPVAYAMTLIGFLGFSFMISLKGGLNLLSRNIYEVFSSYGLTTIPLFKTSLLAHRGLILMGPSWTLSAAPTPCPVPCP